MDWGEGGAGGVRGETGGGGGVGAGRESIDLRSPAVMGRK